ncbi:MAG: hypothetical protein MUP26_08025 [Desulfobulbaceae bacterium]|nr:hypothetical protein [Desulfobulbaceae bacterium]
MKVNCCEHRSSMELLALKLRLKKEEPGMEEKAQIEKRISELEKELAMD